MLEASTLIIPYVLTPEVVRVGDKEVANGGAVLDQWDDWDHVKQTINTRIVNVELLVPIINGTGKLLRASGTRGQTEQSQQPEEGSDFFHYDF